MINFNVNFVDDYHKVAVGLTISDEEGDHLILLGDIAIDESIRDKVKKALNLTKGEGGIDG